MTYWNRFLRSLRVDLRRAVLSGRFAVCVICQVAILVLIASGHMDDMEGVGVTYIFEWFPTESLYFTFLALPAIPFAHSYVSDQHSRFLVQAQVRVGKQAYAASKACAAALSGALSMAMSRLVLLLGLSCLIPVSSSRVMGIDGYAQWVPEGHAFLFLLSQFLISAFLGGLVAVFALWVSTWVKNPFVIVTAPMIAYDAQDIICYLSGLHRFPYLTLYAIIFNTPSFASLTVCLIYSCFILLLLICLFMYLFWSSAVQEV